MHVLVTGGLGFLGSHLVEKLLEDGAHVHVVDDLSTSPIDAVAFCAKQSSRFTVSLASLQEWLSREPSADFDEIYHLASVVGPVGVLNHGGTIAHRVINDTHGIIDLARWHRARLCVVSTSEIYGGGRGGLCIEDEPKLVSPKISPRLEYAVAKLAAEIAIVNTVKNPRRDRSGPLWATIVRPFNIAGPRQSHAGGFVLPRFIRQALAGLPLTVYGDGLAVRAFTHVADVADGIVRSVRRGESGTAYNIGAEINKTTILSLAELVIELTGSESTIDHVDPKVLHGALFEEASDKYPDATLARRELGWFPKYTLERTVRDAIEYIRADRKD